MNEDGFSHRRAQSRVCLTADPGQKAVAGSFLSVLISALYDYINQSFLFFFSSSFVAIVVVPVAVMTPLHLNYMYTHSRTLVFVCVFVGVLWSSV